jgi:hypothetical protein
MNSEEIMSAKQNRIGGKSIPQRTIVPKVFLLLVFSMSVLGLTPKQAQGVAFSVPFHANSIWNKPIAANTVLAPNSEAMIQLLASTTKGAINIDGINGAWSVPVYEADATSRKQVVCDRARYRPCVTVPMPTTMIPSPDTDAKTVILDRSVTPARAWSFWSLEKGDGSNGDWTAGYGAYGWGNITSSGDGIHNYDGGQWGGVSPVGITTLA